MLKSGLIIGVVAFLLAIAGSFVSSLVCVPCWGLVAGLMAGYLGSQFDKPLTTGASAKAGAGTGAIGGAGGLLGQLVGGMANAAFVGPEYATGLVRKLGLAVPTPSPASYYAGSFGVACFLGVFALVLMAGFGAVGGLLWYQIAGKKAATSGMPPTPST